MTDTVNTRSIILDMSMEVIEGDKFSHSVLYHTLKRYQTLEKQERAFISRVFLGTVKQYLTLDYVIDSYAKIPVRKMKPLIRNLLRISVYQLLYMDQIPESAVCNEAVKLAKKRGFDKLSGFVNGNLRNIARNRNEIIYPEKEKDPETYLQVMYSTPSWIVKQLITQYSFETAEHILSTSMKEKKTSIRCNTKKIQPKDLQEMLRKEGVTVEPHEYLNYAFYITDYDYLDKLKSFREGYFTIQDVSSMLVVEVGDPTSKDLIIDVCAAPGGKALHGAERAKKVIARDLTEYKVSLINENITRLGIDNVETQVWDALMIDKSSIQKADVVIADLPCSGLGILGKKADIKYKLTQNQQKELVELQRKILTVIHDYVKPGGILVYSTCTLNMDENIGNRNWFLEHFDFVPESLDSSLPKPLQNDTTKQGYLQLIQGVHSSDGFFISKMRRKS